MKFFLALASGLLLILTFPRPNLSFLAWLALVPLILACAEEARAWQRFFLGWFAGVVFFLGTCYWCFGVMHDYGNLSTPAAAGVLAAMVAGLALYWGLFAAVLPAALGGPLRTLLGVGALWTATEFARGHVFIGFPWLFLGYSTTDHSLLAKLAAWTGVYGLSFLVAAFNAGIFLVIRNPARAWGMRLAGCFFALAALALGGGLLGKEPAPEIAYLMQTAIPLSQPWDLARREQVFAEMQTLLLAGHARGNSQPGMVVWPETPAPLYYHQDAAFRNYLAGLARNTASHLAANTVTFEDPGLRQPLNSAVMLAPSGEFLAQYDKIELVPFGEHVPYARLFFFAGKLTAEVGDFVPGRRYTLLPGPGKSRVAALICYEAGFPGLVREFTGRGAQVLVNISNDGWFGDSPARWQHLLMARMRAIENDRWLLRATNDGISAVVDPEGRVETFPGQGRAVYRARYGLKTSQTIYARWGDWFALLSVAASALLVVLRRVSL